MGQTRQTEHLDNEHVNTDNILSVAQQKLRDFAFIACDAARYQNAVFVPFFGKWNKKWVGKK